MTGVTSPVRQALLATLAYAALAGGCLWLWDRPPRSGPEAVERMMPQGTLKGWGLVAVSAAAFFVLVRTLLGSSRHLADNREFLRRSELERQQVAARYRLLVEHLPAVVYEAGRDISSGIVFISPQVEAMLGFPASEWVDQPLFWHQRIHPEDRPRVTAEFKAAMATGGTFRAEYRLLARDGSVRWVQDEAALFQDADGGGRVHGVLMDCTERRLAEEFLRENRRALATLVSNLPGMVYRCLNDPAWTMEYVSDGCLELTGYQVADLQQYGRISYGQLIHPDDREGVWQEVQRAVSEGRPFRLEYRIQTPHGDEKWVWEQGRPVTDDDGAVVALEGFITDITSRRLVEDQLKQSQKLEALGLLAGGVAHDFNNVMQTILSITPSLEEHRSDPTRHREAVQELEGQIRRAALAAGRLLLFSQRQPHRLRRVDLNQIVRDSGTLLRRLVRENVQFDLALAEQPLPVDADPAHLAQVLLHLVVNAVDTMVRGGHLTLWTGLREGDVLLEVRDDGHGIPAHLLPRVVEPLFTTKSSEQNSGLGLSVVLNIVSEHGGTLELESQEGVGTVVRVILPARVEALAEVGVGGALDAGPLPRGRGRRLLLVEDRVDVREGLRDALTLLGYQVFTAASAEEALALTLDPAPDLMLTDFMLPGRDGADLALELQERWPAVRVVVMSGYARDHRDGAGPAMIAARFLQKPFDLATLASELQAAMEPEA